MITHEVIFIGAGASALMAASGLKNRDIALLESSERAAKKIEISGGGRCNITNKNLDSSNYLGDKSFIDKIIGSFNQNDLLNYLKKRGLTPTLRKKDQYFCPNSSKELIGLLLKDILGVKLYTNQKVLSLKKEDGDFIITTQKEKFRSKKVVVASGGVSFKSLGASDIAYKIAQSFGHSIIMPAPALVGLSLQKEQFWMKNLSGLSLYVKIKTDTKDIKGDLLFAHRGITGPAVLNASLYWKKGLLEIDFVPKIMFDDNFFKSKKEFSSALGLPKRFVKAFFDALGLKNRALYKLSRSEIELFKKIKSYSFAPAGNFGFSKAEVTRGGISTDEIDVNTMMSKKCDGLYFLGECLDVTGELGGYNFQWAFSTAQNLKLEDKY